MPIHFNDRDVISEVEGLSSALIVPCYMCPAVTVSVREKKPFIKLFKNFLKSAPYEEYITTLQARLQEHGVKTKVFKSAPSHVRIPANVTARSGHRDRLAHRCSLAGVFLH